MIWNRIRGLWNAYHAILAVVLTVLYWVFLIAITPVIGIANYPPFILYNVGAVVGLIIAAIRNRSDAAKLLAGDFVNYHKLALKQTVYIGVVLLLTLVLGMEPGFRHIHVALLFMFLGSVYVVFLICHFLIPRKFADQVLSEQHEQKTHRDYQIDELVCTLDDKVRRDAAAYRFKVSLIAALGNAYVSAILLILLALFVALLNAALLISDKWVSWLNWVIISDKWVSWLNWVNWLNWFVVVPIGLLWVFLCLVLRSSWVKIEPPAGVEIKASQAPELFAVINGLGSELDARRFDHVLITHELNAEVFESPRLGIFGWYRSFLLIGLPLLKSLTCEQFKAVVAHELGHHARLHGRVIHSIYRQRLRWTRLMTELETSESKGSFLFSPFLAWFVPYFSAFSFPLARANEYEADAISVRLTSARTLAEALTSLEVVGGYLTDLYWPVIDAEFGEKPQPSREPYSEMSDALATRLDKATGQIWLGPAMNRQTSSEDTHPALRDRLAAIGEEPSFGPPEPGQAADGLLGPLLEETTTALDRRWKENILFACEQRHHEIQEGRRRLKELNENHAHGVDLTLEERIERAELTESIAKNANAALDQWRALHENAPDDARICFALGSRLLMHDDETGCALVEYALQYEGENIAKGCEALRDYSSRNGREEDSCAWNLRLIEESEVQTAARNERTRVTLRDKFQPHGLSKETLADLVAQLRGVSGLRNAYFIKKPVKHFQDHPLYVLGYSVAGLFPSRRNKRAAEVLERIQRTVRFPGETLFVNLDRENHRFGRKFRRVKGTKTRLSSLAVTITKTTLKKVFGVLAVLLGIWTLTVVLNSRFRSSYFDVFDIVPVISLLIMIIVGINWLIDPVD